MFKEIVIRDFRMLQNKKIRLGKYLTMLAGWNATGKSTILALLANSTELKMEKGKTYNNKQFQADFSEILKGSKAYDKAESDRFKIILDNNREKNFRTSWQDKGTRFRVIPKEKDQSGKINEAKFEYPVIYLGLSRLYPLGETDDKEINSSDLKFDKESDKQWFSDNYKEILSMHNEDIKEVTNIELNKKKNTAGINSQFYDWKTNSAGQDNISQILFSILSFKKLKRNNKLNSGLLIIDEIEATLHPKAQEKILNLLIKESRDNGFQTIFTTHSLRIIKIICEKVYKKDENIVYSYFTKINGELSIEENKKYSDIEKDLTMPLYKKEENKKILVFCEDKEAEWFIKKLMDGYNKNLKIISEEGIGCCSLINLINLGGEHFKNYMFVFDGDVKPSDMKKIKK